MKITHISVVVGLLLVSHYALAFKPNATLSSVPDFSADGQPTNHRGVTEKGLSNVAAYTFSAEVKEDIKTANVNIDIFEPFTESAHCDNESLIACNNVINGFRALIVADLINHDFATARFFTGAALHTVQDFYAHSNYAHLYALGKRNDIQFMENGFSATEIQGSGTEDSSSNKTCGWNVSSHWWIDDVPYEPAYYKTRGNTTITTGYFYASNLPNNSVGLADILDPPTYKCRHGDETTGINHDYPAKTDFAIARDLAVKETTHFIEKIIADVKAQSPANYDLILKNYAGMSTSAAKAAAKSDLRLIAFHFGEEKGRMEHTGIFPIHGHPLANTRHHFHLVMAGSVNTATLVLSALDGQVLRRISLTNPSIEGESKKYIGKIVVPAKDFTVSIVGKDTSGNAYKRLFHKVYLVQSIKIEPVHIGTAVAVGKTFKTEFTVENHGLNDDFTVTATNSLDYPITVSQPDVTLGAKKKTKVAVTVTVPFFAQINSGLQIILTVQSKTNAKSANTAFHDFMIKDIKVGDLDQDGDVDSDDLERLRSHINTRAFASNDPRDLNGDMKIDTQDAIKMAMLCTRLNCATN